MTHRDELLALQARVEAQSREIDDAKAEIELLRAAHARKTREAETLRRELVDREVASGEPWPTAPMDARPPDDPGPQRRSFGVAAAMIGGVALASAMMIAAGGPNARQRCQSRAPVIESFEHVGHVVDGSDPAVAVPGETCTVRREPAVSGGGLDCRVEVRCGERVLYGATHDTGYVRCGGRQVIGDREFTARDGDPAMELDLRLGRVVVEEQLGLGTQRVEIELTGYGN